MNGLRPQQGCDGMPAEAILSATLANNLVWLASFGCEITRRHGCIRVHHPELSEYLAWLVEGSPTSARARVNAVLHDLQRPRAAVYVDHELARPEVVTPLLAAGYAEGPETLTLAVRWTVARMTGEPWIEQASLEDCPRWAALYSEGFRRTGRDSEIDRERWDRTFHSLHVRHWFVQRQGRMIGVLQTCHASGVVGIYSLALIPDERGRGTLRRLVKNLRAHLTERGDVLVYFERVKRRASRTLWGGSGKVVVRRWETFLPAAVESR